MSVRRLTKLALLAVAVLVMMPITSAEAAEHELEFANTAGTFNLTGFDPLDVGAGQAGLTGTWDDETGEFQGLTSINPFSLGPPAVPLPIVLHIDPASPTVNVTGTIDPDSGEANLSALMILTIEVPDVATCSGPAFEINFTTDPPDGAAFEPTPFNPDSNYTISLVSSEFTVPAVVVSETCAIADVVNQTAGFPLDGTAVLAFQRGTPTPPTTPTTQATTSTTGATAPAATTSPRFTG
jgi:hypothetical protein